MATGPALVVNNPSGGSALGLQVNAGQAPLTVNADAGKATNLDADKLDGKDKSAFLPSNAAAGGDLSGNYPNPTIGANKINANKIVDEPAVKQSISTTASSLGTSATDVVSVTITAPADGFIHLSADATMNNNATPNYMMARLMEGGTTKRFMYWDGGDADGFFDQMQSIDAVFPVTAGEHTYKLALQMGAGSASVYLPSITAQYFPTSL